MYGGGLGSCGSSLLEYVRLRDASVPSTDYKEHGMYLIFGTCPRGEQGKVVPLMDRRIVTLEMTRVRDGESASFHAFHPSHIVTIIQTGKVSESFVRPVIASVYIYHS